MTILRQWMESIYVSLLKTVDDLRGIEQSNYALPLRCLYHSGMPIWKVAMYLK